ncbi:MAG: RidA family protein [Verrucomicrobiales bacterium]|nr:RidA family protein [Verrucomicrobiales bacterium]
MYLGKVDQWQVVERAIEASFAGGPIPPVVYVEWVSSSYPTEIELIAAAEGKSETKQGVFYFTPEGEKPSPVYSKVAQIHADEVIYIGGMVGSVAEPPVDQVKSLYTALKLIAEKSGGSLHHLVKATYYVSDDDDSAALNQLRPEYYDAKRPPAASKVAIPDLLEKGRGLLIDMVAVPKG